MHEHHIPEFYQSAWAVEDARLYRHSLANPHWRPSRKHPGAFGYLDDYTAFQAPTPNGVHKNAFELDTQVLDSKAARVRDKFLSGTKHSSDEHLLWAQFLWFMRIREPERVAHARAIGKQSALEHFQKDPHEYLAVRGEGEPDNFVDYVKKHHPGFIENAGILFLPGFVNDENAQLLIARMPWTLVDAHGGPRTFLLGDRPLLLRGDIRESKVLLAIPLSPTMAFIASADEQIRERIAHSPPEQVVERLNEETLYRSKDYVFSADTTNFDLIQKITAEKKTWARSS
jgi:hypothetical protein